MTKKKIAVMASGEGTNAEKIFTFFQYHSSIKVVLLLSNRPDANVLKRAARYNIPTAVFSREEFNASKVLQKLKEAGVDFVVLAGFLWLIPSSWLQAYPEKIINIHPALLPKFGGRNMFGSKVHEAVKAAGEKETGITIHYLNERYDEGKQVLQVKCTINHVEDSVEDIARKVQQLEWEHYPRVIEQLVLSGE